MLNQSGIDELNETIRMIIDDMIVSGSGNDDREFLENRFYREPGIYRLPELIQPVMFDLARKMGSVPAIKSMQKVLQTVDRPLKADGIIGPITVTSAKLACILYKQKVTDGLANVNIDYCARKLEKKITHKPVLNARMSNASRRAAQAKLVKVIGARFKEAREICNMTQVLAAEALGYSNSSKLNKIEGASDTVSVPLLTICDAADLYDVSIDFLMGKTDDWERDIASSRQGNAGRWIFEHWKNANKAQVSAFMALNNKLATLEKSVNVAVNRSGEMLTVIRRVQELNPEFNDLRGGSKLVFCAQESVNDAHKALADLKRFHCLIEASHSAGVGLVKNKDLFDYEDDGFDY